MPDGSVLALVAAGLVLGLRHGVDWDHIAAITDIAGSQPSPLTPLPVGAGTGVTAALLPRSEDQGTGVSAASLFRSAGEGLGVRVAVGEDAGGRATSAMGRRPHPANGPDGPFAPLPRGEGTERLGRRDGRGRFFLTTMYALGHATVVTALGLLAIWASTILPDWVDPIMERVVGITLLALGAWIFYSLWRHGRSFRLQSRWMLVFSLVERGWSAIRGKLTGRPRKHSHRLAQYGPRTAFSIGLIHGIGAETGSQALLLAGAAGATTAASGSLMLLAFVVGLLISNSLVAAFSVSGFVSTEARRDVYTAIGVVVGILSLVIGAFFVAGRGTELPDLQQALSGLPGGAPSP
ncbi:MAG: hypothetical protein HYY04_02420 [Chloroflexi bacterium]|nr:hypothetical protein [Chloroflexota bacterium]